MGSLSDNDLPMPAGHRSNNAPRSPPPPTLSIKVKNGTTGTVARYGIEFSDPLHPLCAQEDLFTRLQALLFGFVRTDQGNLSLDKADMVIGYTDDEGDFIQITNLGELDYAAQLMGSDPLRLLVYASWLEICLVRGMDPSKDRNDATPEPKRLSLHFDQLLTGPSGTGKSYLMHMLKTNSINDPTAPNLDSPVDTVSLRPTPMVTQNLCHTSLRYFLEERGKGATKNAAETPDQGTEPGATDQPAEKKEVAKDETSQESADPVPFWTCVKCSYDGLYLQHKETKKRFKMEPNTMALLYEDAKGVHAIPVDNLKEVSCSAALWLACVPSPTRSALFIHRAIEKDGVKSGRYLVRQYDPYPAEVDIIKEPSTKEGGSNDDDVAESALDWLPLPSCPLDEALDTYDRLVHTFGRGNVRIAHVRNSNRLGFEVRKPCTIYQRQEPGKEPSTPAWTTDARGSHHDCVGQRRQIWVVRETCGRLDPITTLHHFDDRRSAQIYLDAAQADPILSQRNTYVMSDTALIRFVFAGDQNDGDGDAQGDEEMEDSVPDDLPALEDDSASGSGNELPELEDDDTSSSSDGASGTRRVHGTDEDDDDEAKAPTRPPHFATLPAGWTWCRDVEHGDWDSVMAGNKLLSLLGSHNVRYATGPTQSGVPRPGWLEPRRWFGYYASTEDLRLAKTKTSELDHIAPAAAEKEKEAEDEKMEIAPEPERKIWHADKVTRKIMQHHFEVHHVDLLYSTIGCHIDGVPDFCDPHQNTYLVGENEFAILDLVLKRPCFETRNLGPYRPVNTAHWYRYRHIKQAREHIKECADEAFRVLFLFVHCLPGRSKQHVHTGDPELFIRAFNCELYRDGQYGRPSWHALGPRNLPALWKSAGTGNRDRRLDIEWDDRSIAGWYRLVVQVEREPPTVEERENQWRAAAMRGDTTIRWDDAWQPRGLIKPSTASDPGAPQDTTTTTIRCAGQTRRVVKPAQCGSIKVPSRTIWKVTELKQKGGMGLITNLLFECENCAKAHVEEQLRLQNASYQRAAAYSISKEMLFLHKHDQ